MKRTTLLTAALALAIIFTTASPVLAMRDLVGYGDGMNLYNYGRSQPIMHTDPMGTVAAAPAAHAKLPPRRFMKSDDFFISGELKVEAFMGRTTHPGLLVALTLWTATTYVAKDNYIGSVRQQWGFGLFWGGADR